MTDLNALMIFAEVVEAKSFTEAARRLGMPVSTVSRRVADLEEDFGTRLLVRSTRRIQATTDGAHLFREARSLADISSSIDRWKASRHPEASKTLGLSAPPSISDTVLAPLLAAFRAAFPHIEVKVFISGQFSETFADGIELKIKIGPRRPPEGVRQQLISFRHQLAASPDYLRKAKPILTPIDLLDHPLLAFAFPSPENSWTLSEVGSYRRETLRFRPHLAIGDYAGLTAVILADGGITDLPPIVQPDLIRDGKLVEVLPGWTLPVFDLCLVHRSDHEVSTPMRVFKDFAGDMMPKLFPQLPS